MASKKIAGGTKRKTHVAELGRKETTTRAKYIRNTNDYSRGGLNGWRSRLKARN